MHLKVLYTYLKTDLKTLLRISCIVEDYNTNIFYIILLPTSVIFVLCYNIIFFKLLNII